MRSDIKGFGTIVREILSEICKDPTYAVLSRDQKSPSLFDFAGVVHLHGYFVELDSAQTRKYAFSLRPPDPHLKTFTLSADNKSDFLR